MKRKFVILFVIAVLLSSVTNAQLNKSWDKIIGSRDQDFLAAAKPTKDGGYILAGISYGSSKGGDKTSNTYGGSDIWIVKLKSNKKDIEWQQSYGGNKDEGHYWGVDIEQTSDGGYILGSSSTSGISGNKQTPNKGQNDYWVIKLNPLGSKVWEKDFGGTGSDVLKCVKQLPDKTYLIGGYSNSPVCPDKSASAWGVINAPDYWVLRLDINGNKLADNIYGGDLSDDLKEIVVIDNDNIFLCGTSDSHTLSGTKTAESKGGYDYWIIKINSNLAQFYDFSFGGAEDDHLTTAMKTKTGLLMFGGYANSNISGDKTEDNRDNSLQTDDIWVVLSDDGGGIVWDKTLGVESGEGLGDIQETKNGSFLLAGWSSSFNFGPGTDKSQPNIGNNGKSDIWLIKLNQNGSKVWDQTIGTKDVDRPVSICISNSTTSTSDDQLFIAGDTDDIISLKAPNNDRSVWGRGLYDYWISLWTSSSTNGLSLINNPIADNSIKGTKNIPEFKLYPCYPNPAGNTTQIKYSLPNLSKVKIQMLDMYGREIEILKDAIQETGEYVYSINTLKYKSGSYTIKIAAVIRDKIIEKSLKLIVTH